LSPGIKPALVLNLGLDCNWSLFSEAKKAVEGLVDVEDVVHGFEEVLVEVEHSLLVLDEVEHDTIEVPVVDDLDVVRDVFLPKTSIELAWRVSRYVEVLAAGCGLRVGHICESRSAGETSSG
jgi:hypothetical protein